jgi:ADP-ribose pyrophosphatase YjhB (NUDIX family)
MLALTLPKGWFDDLQAMETAALRIMAEGRENGA